MFLAIKICMIVLTVIAVFCALVLTTTLLIYLYQKKRQSLNFPSTSFASSDTSSTTNTLPPNCKKIKDVLSLKNNNSAYFDDNSLH